MPVSVLGGERLFDESAQFRAESFLLGAVQHLDHRTPANSALGERSLAHSRHRAGEVRTPGLDPAQPFGNDVQLSDAAKRARQLAQPLPEP